MTVHCILSHHVRGRSQGNVLSGSVFFDIFPREDEVVSRVEQIFSCTKCGYCCKGETTVSLNDDDQTRMVEVIGQSIEQVKNLYWRVSKHCVQMKTVGGHCIFYDDGCKVHAGRPWRCAQWPLHPSILDDENNFRTISDSCPGIKKDVSYEQFCEILKELMEDSVISC